MFKDFAIDIIINTKVDCTALHIFLLSYPIHCKIKENTVSIVPHVSGQPLEESHFKGRDSSVKKNSAFIKKLVCTSIFNFYESALTQR